MKVSLSELAHYYQEHFLDYYYKIQTNNREIIINSCPKHFLHLTGLQRSKKVFHYRNSKQFYYDSLNGKLDIYELIKAIPNKIERNIVWIKISNFQELHNTILNSQYLYLDDDNASTCGLVVSQGVERFQTFTCVYDKDLKFYVPKSNQTDIDEKHSKVIKYDKETIKSTKRISKKSDEGKQLFKDIISS